MIGPLYDVMTLKSTLVWPKFDVPFTELYYTVSDVHRHLDVLDVNGMVSFGQFMLLYDQVFLSVSELFPKA